MKNRKCKIEKRRSAKFAAPLRQAMWWQNQIIPFLKKSMKHTQKIVVFHFIFSNSCYGMAEMFAISWHKFGINFFLSSHGSEAGSVMLKCLDANIFARVQGNR